MSCQKMGMHMAGKERIDPPCLLVVFLGEHLSLPLGEGPRHDKFLNLESLGGQTRKQVWPSTAPGCGGSGTGTPQDAPDHVPISYQCATTQPSISSAFGTAMKAKLYIRISLNKFHASLDKHVGLYRSYIIEDTTDITNRCLSG